MYDIVLVSIPLKGIAKEEQKGYIPGPYYLKGFLNKYDIKTKIIDGHYYIDETDKLIKKIKEYDFRWLGLSILSPLEINLALQIGKHFKNVIYGGSGVNINVTDKNLYCNENLIKQELSKYNHIEGDGYNSLLHLLQTGKLEKKPPLPLEERPLPDYTTLIYDENNINMLKLTGSEGCVNNCTFCNIRDIWKHYIKMPGKRLAQQSIDLIRDNPSFNFINYTDAIFNGSEKELREFCNYLIEKKSKFLWKCRYAIKSNADTEYFDLLEQSNCYEVSIGIESGSEKVRNSMNKKMSDTDIYKHLFSLLFRNIRINILLIVGYPTESNKEFDETLNVLKYIAKYVPKEKRNAIRIYAQSYFLDKSTEKRVLKDNVDVIVDKSPHFWRSKNSDITERLRRMNELYNTANGLSYSTDTLKPKLNIEYYGKFKK
jgi:hypothetical protein